MNVYALIILFALLFNHLLELVADSLNLRSLDQKLPSAFEGDYDRESYEKSQAYTRTTTRFGIITGAFDLALFLLFWFLGGFNLLDLFLRDFDYGPIATGLLFIGTLLFSKTLIDLPFSLYSTFVIEERFGFNRTTPATFVADIAKGILLTLLLGGPLLALVLWFFQFAGPLAWLYCFGAVTLFILFVQFIAPTWIMPLFNKFTPLEEGELRSAVLDYAASVGFPLENLFVMDGSKRSAKSNAFFTGFGKHRRIALFDTLVERHTVSELVAVLAHEIGHYKKKHILKGMIIAIAHMGVMLWLLSFFLTEKGLFQAFYMEQMSVYAGLIFFSLLLSPVETLLSLIMNLLSRRNEYEADRFAAETTGGAAEMISALKKLSLHNLSNLTPHPFYVFLHYSHPPLIQRIEAIGTFSSIPEK